MIDRALLQPTATIVAALIRTKSDQAPNLTETFVKTYRELQAALNKIESDNPPRTVAVEKLNI